LFNEMDDSDAARVEIGEGTGGHVEVGGLGQQLRVTAGHQR
jgi:hypothetical protein